MSKSDSSMDQGVSHLDMEEQSVKATQEIVQSMFSDEQAGDAGAEAALQEGEEEGEQDTVAEEEQEGEGEGEQQDESEKEDEQEGEKEQEAKEEGEEDGAKAEDKQDAGNPDSLERFDFIRDTVSEALADKELKFDSEEDYRRAVQSLADEYKNAKESRDSEVSANEQMVTLFDKHPELVSVVRHLKDKGSDFYEALYSVVDRENIVPDKTADPEGYAKYVVHREREKQSQDAFNEKIRKNSEASQQVIDRFKRERGYDDVGFDKLMDHGHEMLRDLTEYNVSERFLEVIEKAMNYDKDLAQAKKQGEVEGKNKTAQKRRAEKAGDNIPKLTNTGKAKAPEKKKTGDPFLDSLDDMSDEFAW